MDFPIKNGDFPIEIDGLASYKMVMFYSKLLVYQRVYGNIMEHHIEDSPKCPSMKLLQMYAIFAMP